MHMEYHQIFKQYNSNHFRIELNHDLHLKNHQCFAYDIVISTNDSVHTPANKQTWRSDPSPNTHHHDPCSDIQA